MPASPTKNPRSPRPEAPPLPDGDRVVHVVGAAILRPRLCLVARRAGHVRSPGCWEFPGGKVEPGEDARAALVREIHEELDIEIEAQDFLGRGVASLPGRFPEEMRRTHERTIALDVYACRWLGGTLKLTDHDAVRWIQASQVDALLWAPADVPILGTLRQKLSDKTEDPSF